MTVHEAEQRTVQVGDFFEESWGYDQTNVDFYQVVRISSTGKTVWLRHVRSSIVRGGDGGPADYVAPIPDDFDRSKAGDDGAFKRLLRHYNHGNGPEVSVNMTSYSNAYLWDCKPVFQTGAGWGH